MFRLGLKKMCTPQVHL